MLNFGYCYYYCELRNELVIISYSTPAAACLNQQLLPLLSRLVPSFSSNLHSVTGWAGCAIFSIVPFEFVLFGDCSPLNHVTFRSNKYWPNDNRVRQAPFTHFNGNSRLLSTWKSIASERMQCLVVGKS